MVKLMKTGGSFWAIWIKSHQEGEQTTDTVLAERRQALALADKAAADGHGGILPGTYSDVMEWDIVHLLGSDGKPFLGKTRAAMQMMVDQQRRQAWVKHLNEKQEHRQTIRIDALNTPELLGWNDFEARFYWRAISLVLHTSARKNLFDSRWPSHCWLCPGQEVDTQAHKFGAGGQHCVSTCELKAKVTHGIRRALNQQWTPDQEYYLPAMDHEIAAATGYPTRPR